MCTQFKLEKSRRIFEDAGDGSVFGCCMIRLLVITAMWPSYRNALRHVRTIRCWVVDVSTECLCVGPSYRAGTQFKLEKGRRIFENADDGSVFRMLYGAIFLVITTICPSYRNLLRYVQTIRWRVNVLDVSDGTCAGSPYRAGAYFKLETCRWPVLKRGRWVCFKTRTTRPVLDDVRYYFANINKRYAFILQGHSTLNFLVTSDTKPHRESIRTRHPENPITTGKYPTIRMRRGFARVLFLTSTTTM